MERATVVDYLMGEDRRCYTFAGMEEQNIREQVLDALTDRADELHASLPKRWIYPQELREALKERGFTCLTEYYMCDKLKEYLLHVHDRAGGGAAGAIIAASAMTHVLLEAHIISMQKNGYKDIDQLYATRRIHAMRYPNRMLCDMLGLSEEDRQRLEGLMEIL